MVRNNLRLPSLIYLYQGIKTKNFKIHSLKKWLEKFFKTIKIEIREEFVSHWLLKEAKREEKIEELSYKFASIRVQDPGRGFSPGRETSPGRN